YDKVPQKLVNQQIMDRHAYRIRNKIMDWMVNWGCYETLNYSFCDPRQMEDLGYEPQSLPFINLINPQSSNQSVMRVSLIPQLITNLAYNLNHAERNVKLFEQAKVYHKTDTGHQEPMQMAAIFSGMRSAEHWQSKAQTIDFSWVKGCLESMLGSLNLPHTSRSCERPYLVTAESRAYFSEDTELGVFGRLKPELLAKWGIDLSILKQDVWIIECNVDAIVAKTRSVSITYQPISRFPAVLRDLSFLAPLQVQYQDIREQILAIDPALVQEIEVFDEYRSKQIPEGFRSLSMHIILQDQEKTLTDERVDQLMDLVQKTLTDKYDIRMR
ncbi:MAG TPA: phenylalanine--tRNA ligase subunit beta, partial [Candidatus Cloacimonadota bacterium]|nr:phenylalanine--tRNA ligase subunit beta [Candidatus Cloacimonadota bacterium]